MATSEDYNVLRERFPLAVAWEQAASQEGGSVTPDDLGQDMTTSSSASPWDEGVIAWVCNWHACQVASGCQLRWRESLCTGCLER
jgi:hypothetical protein